MVSLVEPKITGFFCLFGCLASIAVIEAIEQTTDAKKLQALEEKRFQLHGIWMDLLKEQGIAYRDREHATKIAIKVARGEL
jgi:hypothetical protein